MSVRAKPPLRVPHVCHRELQGNIVTRLRAKTICHAVVPIERPIVLEPPRHRCKIHETKPIAECICGRGVAHMMLKYTVVAEHRGLGVEHFLQPALSEELATFGP